MTTRDFPADVQLDNDPGCSHSVKTRAGPNEHFNEHTGFDSVVGAAAAFSLL